MMKRRMQGHRNNGAINEHFTQVHGRKPQVTELTDNTTIIHREPLNSRLRIAEAVSIELQQPNLNIQTEFDLILPSKRRRRTHHAPADNRGEEGPMTDAPQQAQHDIAATNIVTGAPTYPQVVENNVRTGGGRQLRKVPRRDYTE